MNFSFRLPQCHQGIRGLQAIPPAPALRAAAGRELPKVSQLAKLPQPGQCYIPVPQVDRLRLPMISPPTGSRLDAAQVLVLLAQLDEVYQAPVALFYLQDYSYNEIADILEVPLGTVKSRLSRGLGHLHQLLTGEKIGTPGQ
jgi:DNA-directed RNA polymerase specialized sigma24 family protein